MITDSSIAFGDQLGAQMGTLAALMHIGIQIDQEIVFWEELKNYRRGLQFLNVFNIDGIRMINRSGRLENKILEKYFKAASQNGNWKRQMNRIYKSHLTKLTDHLVYKRIRRHYTDFLTFDDLRNDIYTDEKLMGLDSEKNFDIQNGFGTYRDWGKNATEIISRFHFQNWVIQKGNKVLSELKTEDKKRIAVHLRRTDYLVMSSLNLGNEYYLQAMHYFDPNEVSFIVFSDDIEECRKMDLFKSKNILFIDQHEAAVDMYLMSQMDGNIVANSSFSVWGALLNKRAERIICPYHFVGPSSPENLYINGNYYPKSWIAV